MKLTHNEYVTKREFFAKLAERAIRDGNEGRADYYVGIVRGLDLAFGEGSAASTLTFGKESN